MVLLDVHAGAPEHGPEFETHVLAHLRGQIARGALRGDSAQLPSRRVFAWRRHDDLRRSGSLADRLDARIELADRRLAMARIIRSEGR